MPLEHGAIGGRVASNPQLELKMKSNQKGNIIILFTIVAGVFAGLFLIFGEALFSLKKIKNRSNQKLLILDSEKTMLIRLAKRVHKISKDCSSIDCRIPPGPYQQTAADFISYFNSAPSPSPRIMSNAELNQLVAANGSMSSFDAAKEAVTRCTRAAGGSPQWSQGFSGRLGYYFCVQFPQNDSEGTIFSSPHFAEFRVNAVDLLSQNPNEFITLQSYINESKSALKVYYRIYWSRSGDPSSRFVRTGEVNFSRSELEQ